MRWISAFAVLAVLALLSFGYATTVALPQTPDDAMAKAVSGSGGSDTYIWTCPMPDGQRKVVSEIHIEENDFDASMHRDVIRSSSVYAPSPSSFVDPDDPYVREIAAIIDQETEGLPEIYRAMAALGFVQTAIVYKTDSQVFGQSEFWTYPVETLYLHSGDCEDKSILLCSIFGALGFDSVLLDFDGHMAVAVDADGASGAHYKLSGRPYYYCETTAGFSIGYIPYEYSGMVPVVRIPGSDPLIPAVLDMGFAWYRSAVQKVLGI